VSFFRLRRGGRDDRRRDPGRGAPPLLRGALEGRDHRGPARAAPRDGEGGTPNPSVGSVAYLLDKRRRAAGRRLVDPIHVPDRPEINDLRVDFPKLEDYDDL
jgi:hypothetical protein